MTTSYLQGLPKALAKQFEEGHCLDLAVISQECKGEHLHRTMLTVVSAKVRLALDGVTIAGMLCPRHRITDHRPQALILPNQSIDSISAMIDFLYYGVYEEEESQLLRGHLSVYILAQLLDFCQLKDHSIVKICEYIRRDAINAKGIPAKTLTDSLRPLVDSLPLLYEHKIAECLEALFLSHARSLWSIDQFQDLCRSGLGGGKFTEDFARSGHIVI